MGGRQQTRIKGLPCPACAGKIHRALELQLYECVRCGALHGIVYRGELWRYVRPLWADRQDIRPEDVRYFDLTVLASDGVQRLHGWYDVISRRVVQVG